MPELSADMTEADLLCWLVKPGDRVEAGDLLAEIETDKSTVEFESQAAGTLIEIHVPGGTDGVAVGTLLAILEESHGDAALPSSPTPGPAAASASAPGTPTVEPIDPAHSSTADQEPLRSVAATALARRLADRAGLDLASISGTGTGGRIVKADIEAAQHAESPGAEAPAAAAPMQEQRDAGDAPFTAVLHSRMRRTIAARLTEAKQTIPHFYLRVECEIDRLLEIRRRLNAEGQRISVNDFIVRAAALALVEVPAANVSWTEEALRCYERIDVAVAVATEGGIVTPVVREADRKELAVLSAELRDLAERARGGKLLPREYRGGSVTVSNLGMYGVESVYPILNPPQSCILGIGAGTERAVARDGALAVATVMTCTLAADHRALDGAVGASFLGAFKERIEDPLEMLL